MRLKLKNFRCYLEKEFDFGENGLLLLSGVSGQGKSTILLAINFCLYGTGNKLVTSGKTSCKVELWYDDLYIVRTKRPNRLVINDIHEDSTAQSIIDNKFGKTFDVTSYIAQNSLNSFVMMGDTEKLSFLERFAFSDINLIDIKRKCRDLIKQRNEQLISTTSQLTMATKVLQEMSKPQEVKFPLKGKNKQKAMNNEQIRLKNTETLIRKAERNLAKTTSELNDLKILNTKIKIKTETLTSINEKIQKCQLEKVSIPYEGNEKLFQYEQKLIDIMSQQELQLLLQRYEENEQKLQEMILTEQQDFNKKITKIDENIWKEYSKEEVNSMIVDYKELLVSAKMLESLYNDLNGYENVDTEVCDTHKKELQVLKEKLDAKKQLISKLKLQQECYKCPSCNQLLRFHDETLHLAENVEYIEGEDAEKLSEEIKMITLKISRLERMIYIEQNCIKHRLDIDQKIQKIKNQYDDDIPSVSDIESDIDYIKSYKNSQLELEKQKNALLKSIKSKQYSSIVCSFQDSLSKQKEKIDQLKKNGNREFINIDVDEIRDIIQIQRSNKQKIENINNQLQSLLSEQSKYQSQIVQDRESHEKTYKKMRSVERVEKSVNKRQKEITNLSAQKKIHITNLIQVEKYKAYISDLEKYQEWETKVRDLTIKEETDRKKYAGATLFKEKIVESESIAMLNIINSINSHTQTYLDLFFTTDPMVARLLPYKETKKNKKPQINIQIEYKGIEADLKMLSGGELSRVVLAFTLGLGEIFNTPLMLLDECTASLGQELTTQVIDAIRENYNDKLVIVIAHQVVSGHFDRVIQIQQ